MFYRFSALACANVSKSGEMFTLVGLSRRHLGKPELRKVEIDDFLKKYTSASRKRVTHTEQMKLRDKERNQTNTFELKAFLWHV